MKRPLVGAVAKALDAIPVDRPQDLAKAGSGKIFLSDTESGSTILYGTGTEFTKEVGPRTLLTLPNKAGSAEVLQVVSDTELILAKPFSGEAALRALTSAEDGTPSWSSASKVTPANPTAVIGSAYKVTPHVDQKEMFAKVTEKLAQGECVGIFPEGGSHDRTQLLPLKVGVSIMALTAMANTPAMKLKLVPVGLGYFHAHQFRSRAVVEFGEPIDIKPEWVAKYQAGGNGKKEAVNELMDTVKFALKALTVEVPDYETLKIIRAARRIYVPEHSKLSPPEVFDLTRGFVKGFMEHKDNPRVMTFTAHLKNYNSMLMSYGIRDHQVHNTGINHWRAGGLLVLRIVQLILIALTILPGIVLNGPIFLLSVHISKRKAREALAASSVKVKGFDVLATWKVMISAVGLPLLYLAISITTHILLATYTNFAPASCVGIAALVFIFLPFLTYYTVRIGEAGKDILLSLRPLMISLFVPQRETEGLRGLRKDLLMELSAIVTEVFAFDEPLLDIDGHTPAHKRRNTTLSTASASPTERWFATSEDRARSVYGRAMPPVDEHRVSIPALPGVPDAPDAEEEENKRESGVVLSTE
ncbi:hypothetical protein HDV05_004828 [Chytridiales sp. JEL 0842]|nr:hypothetical protein HDV05_004828 [Chytridiales sp. JEL 0842]